jgi:hypothetical protein
MASLIAPSGKAGWIRSVPGLMHFPPLKAWIDERDLPPAPARSFREMWRRR